MKARIKETGDIVDVVRSVDRYIMSQHPHTITFEKDELDFDINEPDYWTRLEHQYAGMAMQGMLSNPACENLITKAIVKEAVDIATALVEKLKEKEERK